MSQADAQYQDRPKNGLTCAACSLFRNPRSCEIVSGDITPMAGANFLICPIKSALAINPKGNVSAGSEVAADDVGEFPELDDDVRGGAEKATDRLANGRVVTVSCADGETGNVYDGEPPFGVTRVPVGYIAPAANRDHGQSRQSRTRLSHGNAAQ